MARSWAGLTAAAAAIVALGSACGAATDESGNGSEGASGCAAGQAFPCACTDGSGSTQTCLADGTLGPCGCGTIGPTAGGNVPPPGPTTTSAPTSPAPTSTTEPPPPAPTSTTEPPPPTTTVEPPPPPPPDPTVEPPPPPPPPDPSDPFDALRNTCVDTINTYRATLGLPSLVRARNDLELCADEGAKEDSERYALNPQDVHGSFSRCPSTYAQNTCPGWNTFGGEEGALAGCFDMMWAEGEPPVGRAACEADKPCYQEYGHYLAMSNPTYGSVSCGFYRMPNGEIWMNQNFGP